MAADVASAWVLYDAMTGTQKSHDRSPAEAGPHAAADASSLRIGIPRRYFLDHLDDGVRERFAETIDRLKKAGARVSDVDVPHVDATSTVYLHIQLPESSAYHATALEREPSFYIVPVRVRLEMGRYVLAEDYARAQRGREVLRHEVDAALAGVDALALPTLPIPAPELGQAAARLGETELPVRAVMLRLTQLFNITGHPAISLPCGRTPAGLPIGLQLVGRRRQTPALLAIALACERLCDR